MREDAQGLLVPEIPVYRLVAAPPAALQAPSRILRGTLHLEGERESLLGRWGRRALAVLVRESGF